MKKDIFKFLLLVSFLIVSKISHCQIYLHDFGSTTISSHPYTVTPSTFPSGLSSSSWMNSSSSWTSFTGSTGQALSLNNSGGTPTLTLTFSINSGCNLDITSFNFWRQRSSTGAQNWSMTINGTNVGSGTVPTTGASIGTTSVSSMTGLTGTVTVVISLSGASGTGTFRLDDFNLDGTINCGNTITTGVISTTPFILPDCTSPTTGTVTFTSVGTYTSGNTYTTQLSNSSGLFTTPTDIGTLSSISNSGTINITIPGGIISSNNYRIRVISSSPSIIGTTSSSFNITLTCASVCPIITGALVDGCDATNEGFNEMVLFKTGSSSVNINDMSIAFPNLDTYCNSGCSTRTLVNNSTVVSNLNTTAGCTNLLTYSSTIPPNSNVIVFTGNPPTYNFNFTTLCGTGPYYVIFANNTSATSGRFKNFDGVNSVRNLGITFSGSCSQTVSYNTNGFSSGSDGQSVMWDNLGNPTYVSDGCTPNAIILPIEVQIFETEIVNNKVELTWIVSDNKYINYFEISHSIDGENFEVIDIIKSDRLLSEKKYKIKHSYPIEGINYYKIKIVDINGEVNYSDIKSINFNSKFGTFIFPNPVELGNNIYLNLQSIDEDEIIEVSVTEQIGKSVIENSYKGLSSFYINTSTLSKGVYFIKVKSKGEIISQRIIII